MSQPDCLTPEPTPSPEKRRWPWKRIALIATFAVLIPIVALIPRPHDRLQQPPPPPPLPDLDSWADTWLPTHTRQFDSLQIEDNGDGRFVVTSSTQGYQTTLALPVRVVLTGDDYVLFRVDRSPLPPRGDPLPTTDYYVLTRGGGFHDLSAIPPPPADLPEGASIRPDFHSCRHLTYLVRNRPQHDERVAPYRELQAKIGEPGIWHISKKLTFDERCQASSYHIGDTVRWFRSALHFERGQRLTVVSQQGVRVRVKDKEGSVHDLPLELAHYFDLERTEIDKERPAPVQNPFTFDTPPPPPTTLPASTPAPQPRYQPSGANHAGCAAYSTKEVSDHERRKPITFHRAAIAPRDPGADRPPVCL